MKLRQLPVFFHPNNHMATQQLCIQLKGNGLAFNSHQVYLGVMMDRTLSYKYHLQKTASRVSARCKLARTTRGTCFQVLKTSTTCPCAVHCGIRLPSVGEEPSQWKTRCHETITGFMRLTPAIFLQQKYRNRVSRCTV